MKTNDELGRLLKKWDTATLPDFKNKEKISAEIIRNIRTGKKLPFQNSRRMEPQTIIFRLAASAAIVALVLTSILIFNGRRNSLEKLASINNEELTKINRVYAEIKNLFPEGINWIQSSGNSMSINSYSDKQISPTGKKILLRYLILKNENGKWRQISSSDIIVSPDNMVCLDNGYSGSLWADSRKDDNLLAIDAQFRIKADGKFLNVDFSGGQAQSSPVELENPDSKYKIFQTVTTLNG